MKCPSRFWFPLSLLLMLPLPLNAQQSVARQWNEALLNAIRHDLARPTVHARNLFHTSLAMYDAWAAYDTVAQTFLLGKTVGGYTVPFSGISRPADVQSARDTAISYAAYRLLKHRFASSPGAVASLARFDSVMIQLGYDTTFVSADYSTGSAAALGNYIAQSLINFGLQDGSNEQNNYAYQHYSPVNPPLIVLLPGDSALVDPNRWQPLALTVIIDQNGNVIPGNITKFVSPEWGEVTPFALSASDLTVNYRGGYGYKMYDDPGEPPLLDTLNSTSAASLQYKWAYSFVAVWSSHLKASDTVMWDISPASIGNAPPLPQSPDSLRAFYNMVDGGDAGKGRKLNPRTGMPYSPEYVPRGDYTRVLAEFWADGPNSETPPGHWFVILNYVSDHTAGQHRFGGQGPVLDDLEWDVKSYFALAGAVHDAAVTCWGIKGWYDGVRPISAIRWMAGRGQCSDSTLPHYSPAGIPLMPGFIELVQHGDSLAGVLDSNVNKIKILAWEGPQSITDPKTQDAPVGWMLAERWWPYQRPTFVTPPFAGYTSGHSTYSRAAAEVLTALTGDEYFPGGMGEFFAAQNHYLGTEEGPSVDVTLEWATYRDAADQCSLSRIWGGIHPPTDDMPGRLIGRKVGVNAFALAEKYFNGQVTSVRERLAARKPEVVTVYPNPARSGNALTISFSQPVGDASVEIYNMLGQRVSTHSIHAAGNSPSVTIGTGKMAAGVYMLRMRGRNFDTIRRELILK